MTLTVIAPPADPPVSIGQARDELRIGHAGEDDYIARLIDAATERLENAAGLALVTRTLRKTYSHWPARLRGRGELLRPGPVIRLVSASVRHSSGAIEDHSDRFKLDDCGRLVLRPWSILASVDDASSVEVDFETGFSATASGLPADLRQAVLVLVAQAYGRQPRASDGEDAMPAPVQAILAARREVRI